MSVSRYPNATLKATEELWELWEQLVPTIDPAIDADHTLIMAASGCAMMEEILNMRSLPLYHKLDKVILQEMRDLLRSCT